MDKPNHGFFGSHDGRFDGKNRLALPADFRDAARGVFTLLFYYVTHESSIRLVSATEWERLRGRLKSYGSTNEAATRYDLTMTRYSGRIDFDTQGRFLVKKDHLDLAGITESSRNVEILGRGECVDVWSKERLDAFQRDRVYEVHEVFGPYREAAKKLTL